MFDTIPSEHGQTVHRGEVIDNKKKWDRQTDSQTKIMTIRLTNKETYKTNI